MDVIKRMNAIADAGASRTQKLYARAKGSVQDLGTRASLSLDIARLERESRKAREHLGLLVYKALVKTGKRSVSIRSPGVEDVIYEISLHAVETAKLRRKLSRMGRKAT